MNKKKKIRTLKSDESGFSEEQKIEEEKLRNEISFTKIKENIKAEPLKLAVILLTVIVIVLIVFLYYSKKETPTEQQSEQNTYRLTEEETRKQMQDAIQNRTNPLERLTEEETRKQMQDALKSR